MRPARFQQFAIATYRAAGLTAQEWDQGTKRPYGIVVTLPGGAQVRHAITAQAREGDKYDEPEQPVEGEAPAPMPVPELGAGRPAPVDVERHLAAVLNNSGSTEIVKTYSYSDREQPPQNPGFGLTFHSGARVFCLLES